MLLGPSSEPLVELPFHSSLDVALHPIGSLVRPVLQVAVPVNVCHFLSPVILRLYAERFEQGYAELGLDRIQTGWNLSGGNIGENFWHGLTEGCGQKAGTKIVGVQIRLLLVKCC